jgi:hypothetical protein
MSEITKSLESKWCGFNFFNCVSLDINYLFSYLSCSHSYVSYYGAYITHEHCNSRTFFVLFTTPSVGAGTPSVDCHLCTVE